MRILITTGIFPPDIGGPATYVPTIAKALAERGHQVTVLTTSEPENLQRDDSIYPFLVFRINRRQKIWLRSLKCIAEILRLGRTANVIYANGIYFETAIANKFLRKPLVMKIVGDKHGNAVSEEVGRRTILKTSNNAVNRGRQNCSNDIVHGLFGKRIGLSFPANTWLIGLSNGVCQQKELQSFTTLRKFQTE